MRALAAAASAPGGRGATRTATWLARGRRLGLAGIVFFTVKGLLWLIVPALAAKLLT